MVYIMLPIAEGLRLPEHFVLAERNANGYRPLKEGKVFGFRLASLCPKTVK